MAHLALYRKYRSQSFRDLVGQEHVVRTLRNAIESGKIAHAYLFTGPRGTGKTSTARLLAKALNCTDGPSADPKEDDPICQEIAAGSCMDVTELDAASDAGVDDIRERIVEASAYQPTHCRYRIFIIDEVHDLSPKAFDALLKTIEEPPPHVVFILATTAFNKVPPTIRSRCQKFEFHRGTIQDIAARLTHVCEQEGIKAEPAAISAIARMADGGYRDALTLLEQAAITAEGDLTLAHVYDQLGLVADDQLDDLLRAMAKADVPDIIRRTDAIYLQGRDPRSILESLLYRLSDLTRARYQIESPGQSDAAIEASLTATAGEFSPDLLLNLRAGISEAHRTITEVSLPRIWLEAEFVRLARLASAPAVTPKAAAVAETVSATRQAQPVAATPKAAEPKPAPAQEPAVTPAAETHESPDEASWRAVVTELSGMSRTAMMRLEASHFASRNEREVVVQFSRQADADWVEGNSKLVKAIHDAWAKHSGKAESLRFVATGNRPSPPDMQPTAVDLPLEGKQLAEAARQILTGDPAENSTTS